MAARQEAALATAVGCANRGGRAAAEALEASAVQGEEAAAQREAAGAALATVIGVVMRGGTAAADALEAAALLSQTRLAFAAAASMRERSLFDRGLTLLRVDGSRAAARSRRRPGRARRRCSAERRMERRCRSRCRHRSVARRVAASPLPSPSRRWPLERKLLPRGMRWRCGQRLSKRG